MSLAVVTWILAAILTQQFVGLIGLLLLVRPAKPKSSQPEASELPAALVILPLRGADPGLKDCVLGLAEQDYPRYRVRVVVDSLTDPARSVVKEVIDPQRHSHVELLLLESPPSTCSLKCSAVHQATASLPAECELVATLDSDVTPHSTWLRELAEPFADPRIGGAVGNRWYAPSRGDWGSWVRYLWNCASLVVMYYSHVPWGGTLAMRASVLRDTDIRQRWLKAGCEDLLLWPALQELKLKLKFVPSLIMVNDEDISLPGCTRFIVRQLLWTRLYHGATWWISSLIYVLINVLIMVALIGAAITALDTPSNMTWLLAGTVCVYFAAQSLQVLLLERFVRSHLRDRGEASAKLSWRTFVAIPLCQLCYLAWTGWSLLCRQITWRGIHYEIGGRWDIHMVKYEPYQPTSGMISFDEVDRDVGRRPGATVKV